MQKYLKLKAELPIERWLGFFIGGKEARDEKTYFVGSNGYVLNGGSYHCFGSRYKLP